MVKRSSTYIDKKQVLTCAPWNRSIKYKLINANAWTKRKKKNSELKTGYKFKAAKEDKLKSLYQKVFNKKSLTT